MSLREEKRVAVPCREKETNGTNGHAVAADQLATFVHDGVSGFAIVERIMHQPRELIPLRPQRMAVAEVLQSAVLEPLAR